MRVAQYNKSDEREKPTTKNTSLSKVIIQIQRSGTQFHRQAKNKRVQNPKLAYKKY